MNYLREPELDFSEEQFSTIFYLPSGQALNHSGVLLFVTGGLTQFFLVFLANFAP